jgi:hypothetical protein
VASQKSLSWKLQKKVKTKKVVNDRVIVTTFLFTAFADCSWNSLGYSGPLRAMVQDELNQVRS